MSEESAAVSTRPARKRQQRSIQTQEKLLDAAIEAFAENGFKGTSTRDIADRAGVHHPLITYHFKNKERLWRAATDRVFGELQKALTDCANRFDGRPADERMAALIRTYLEVCRQQPGLHKVMAQEASNPSARLDWLVDSHLKPLLERGVALFEELQQTGAAPVGNPALLLNMIRMAGGGLLALGSELNESCGIDIDDPAVIDELGDLLIRVFLPGLESESRKARLVD